MPTVRRRARLGVVATLAGLLAAVPGPAASASRTDLRCRAALGSGLARALRGPSAARPLATVDRACRAADTARALFVAGDPATALAGHLAAELAASDALLLRDVPIGDRRIARCRRAIARARGTAASAVVRRAGACQRRIDRTAATLSSLASACAGTTSDGDERLARRIARACTGLDAAAAGTCTALPECVVASATDMGAALAAVAWGATPGVQVELDLNGDIGTPDSFWSLPWPSDLRLRDDGRPDMTGHPLPLENPGPIDIRSLALVAEDRPRFPTIATTYFRFSAPVAAQEPARLIPAAASEAILLVDVDPTSTGRGRLFPVVAQTPASDAAWRTERLLAVGPLPGTILPAGRRFAVVVRRTLGDASGEPLGVPAAMLALRAGGTPPGRRGGTARTLYADALATLDALGVARADVAAMTVFTTGDVVRELAVEADALRARDGAGVMLAAPTLDEVHDRFCELRTTVRLPQYQRGIPDYDADGRFVRGTDGLPEVQRDEDAPVVLTIPRTPMPAGGYPLVVYFHGSAGLAAQVVDRGPYTSSAPDAVPTPGRGPGWVLAAHGIAAAGPAMPLNPERLPNAAHRSYLNLDNLSAYPFTFRQGAIEQRMLLDALGRLAIDPTTLAGCDGVALPPGETHVRFATERVGIMGQSMGAQYANLVSAVDPRVAGAVPTGSGGLWGYVFLEAQVVEVDGVPLAIRPLIPGLLAASEPLSHLHPAFNLLETAWEWAETAVFASRIARDPLPGQPQRSVYLPVADDDPGFPNTVYTAMALASGTAQAGEVRYPGLQTTLATDGLDGVAAYPVSRNVSSRTGAAYTGVVVQYHSDGIRDGHHVFAQLDAVKHQYGCFFATLLLGNAAVVPAPAALGTPCTAEAASRARSDGYFLSDRSR